MRKNVFGRQFKRDRNERKSLFKSLISSLIVNERIKTTEHKAKAIRAEFDKIVTKAKKGEKARRMLGRRLLKDAIDKVIGDIGPRFAERPGGYSRIIKIGRRLSDNAEMVLMELVEGDKNSESKIQSSELESLEGIDKKKQEVKTEENKEKKKSIKTVRESKKKVKDR